MATIAQIHPSATRTAGASATTWRMRSFLAPVLAGLLGASAALVATWIIVASLTLHMSI